MKNHIYNYLGLLTVTSTVAVAGAAPAQAVTLDEFNQNQTSQTVQDNDSSGQNFVTNTKQFTSSGFGIDFDRTIGVKKISGPSGLGITTEVVTQGIGLKSTSNNSSVEGNSFLSYDPQNASGDFDLTQGGNDALSLELLTVDKDVGVDLNIETTSGNATGSTVVPDDATGSLTFALNSLNNSGNATFSSVEKIRYDFDFAPEGEIATTEVNTVPYEMETGFGLAAAAALFGYRKFRKSRAKRQNNAVAE